MEKFKKNNSFEDAIAMEMGMTKNFFKMAGIDIDGETVQEIEKPEDDGTVRGLVFSGDYTRVADFVMVQGVFEDKTMWTYREGYSGGVYTGSKDSGDTYSFKKADDFAKEIVTASRRKIKKKEIVLCALEEGWTIDELNGIIFTEDKILSLSDGKPEYLIRYDEIKEVDFDDENVIITVADGEEATIHCDDESSGYGYSKGIFNLIMDIRERLEEQ